MASFNKSGFRKYPDKGIGSAWESRTEWQVHLLPASSGSRGLSLMNAIDQAQSAMKIHTCQTTRECVLYLH